MRRFFLASIMVLVGTSTVEAQSITSYNFRVYNAGAQNPIQAPSVIQSADVQCNLSPVPANPGPIINTATLAWDDPDNTGQICLFTDSGTGPIFSVPIGVNLEATLTAVNSVGESPESNRAPFLLGAVPNAPSGLVLQR